MLLAVDVGNTHTVFGLFSGATVRADWRVATRKEMTSDELGVLLRALFDGVGLETADVKAAIVSSVVPDLNGVFQRAVHRYCDCEPLFVGPGLRTGMPIQYDNPHDVGADRIVNAVAAKERFGAPVIVLDFGTATTFDVVDATGSYLGGVIAPGPAASAEALFAKAARLPRVDVARPARVIGRNTVQSMQSGLFHGYTAMVQGVVARIRAELGSEAPVVATGGLSRLFATELDCLAAVDPQLTLTGLRLLWERNHR